MLDPTKDVGARNVRRICALYSSATGAGFEVVHGLLDRVMTANGVAFGEPSGPASPKKGKKPSRLVILLRSCVCNVFSQCEACAMR